jgi:hypothetical protein
MEDGEQGSRMWLLSSANPDLIKIGGVIRQWREGLAARRAEEDGA